MQRMRKRTAPSPRAPGPHSERQELSLEEWLTAAGGQEEDGNGQPTDVGAGGHQHRADPSAKASSSGQHQHHQATLTSREKDRESPQPQMASRGFDPPSPRSLGPQANLLKPYWTRRRVMAAAISIFIVVLLGGQLALLIFKESSGPRASAAEGEDLFDDDPVAQGGTDLIAVVEGPLVHRLHTMCLADAYASIGALSLEILWVPDASLPHAKFADLFSQDASAKGSSFRVRHWRPPQGLLSPSRRRRLRRPQPPANFVSIQATLGCCNATSSASADALQACAKTETCTATIEGVTSSDPQRHNGPEDISQGFPASTPWTPDPSINLFVYRGNTEWSAWAAPPSCDLLEEVRKCYRRLSAAPPVRAMLAREDLPLLRRNAGVYLQPQPQPQALSLSRQNEGGNGSAVCLACQGCARARLLSQTPLTGPLEGQGLASPGAVGQGPSSILHCYAGSMAASVALTPPPSVRQFVVGAVHPEDALALTSLLLPEEAPLVLNTARLLLLAHTGHVLRQRAGRQPHGQGEGDEGVHRDQGESSVGGAEAEMTMELQRQTGRRLMQGLLRGTTTGSQGEGEGEREGVPGLRRATRAQRRAPGWAATGGDRSPVRRLMQELHAPRKEVQLALEGWPPEMALLASDPGGAGAEGVQRARGVAGGQSSVARSVLLAQWELTQMLALAHTASLLYAYPSPAVLFIQEQAARANAPEGEGAGSNLKAARALAETADAASDTAADGGAGDAEAGVAGVAGSSGGLGREPKSFLLQPALCYRAGTEEG